MDLKIVLEQSPDYSLIITKLEKKKEYALIERNLDQQVRGKKVTLLTWQTEEACLEYQKLYKRLKGSDQVEKTAREKGRKKS